MKQRSSSYPIGELLLKTFHASGLKLPDFMRAIGYGNAHNGIATFDTWLQNGSGNGLFLERLTKSAYAPPIDELRTALAETEQIRTAERHRETLARIEVERKNFRPFVQGTAELSRPTSITMFAFTGGPARYTVTLPFGFGDLSHEAKERLVAGTIRDNFAANNGRTLFMGKITGYLLFLEYGERPIRYTVDGIKVGEVDARPAQHAVVTLNGRPIPMRAMGC